MVRSHPPNKRRKRIELLYLSPSFKTRYACANDEKIRNLTCHSLIWGCKRKQGCKRCKRFIETLKLSFEIFQNFMVKVSLFHEALGEEGETSIYAGAKKSDQVRQLGRS